MAMTLLLLDFVALPACAIALVVLLAMYYRGWSAYVAGQRAARSTKKEA